MGHVILINGVPASGKSTIARTLVARLAAGGVTPVPMALDTLKEGLFAQIGTGDRDYNRMLGRASYHAIFNLISEFPAPLLPVIDAWHGFQPRSVLEEHLHRARITRVVELWVAVAPDIAAARYRARADGRHAGHLPSSYATELAELAETARPTGIGEVIAVDGGATLPDDIAERILTLLRA